MSEEYKLNLLNNVLMQCKNSDFYKYKTPDRKLYSLDEIKYLPLTTKEDIRDNSPYGFICVPRKELYQYHETFGTTGEPASAWLTREDVWDHARRVNDSGISFNENDVVLIRFPYAISTVAHFTHNAAQMKNACVIPASSRTTVSPFTRIVKLLRKLDVTVLACLPLQAILIAETAEMLGLDPRDDFPSLRAVYTAGEAMTPNRRKVIEKIWGVPVNDNYGMTEIGPAVTDCVYGVPHPLQDSFVFEVLDDNFKADVKPGEVGNLVVTTLTRKACPLIRYVTGDRVRITREKCPCGKEFKIEIRGRNQDVVRIGDRAFDIWDFGEIVSHFPCQRFWVVGPDSEGLHFVVEREKQNDFVSDKLIQSLTGKYEAKISVDIVPQGVLYDRGKLLSVGVVGKPRYIYSRQEMEEQAYLKSARI